MPVHDPKLLPRVRLHYHTVYNAHVINFHIQNTSDPAIATSSATTVANGLKGLLRSTGEQFDGAEFILAGTNVANPVTFTPVLGTNASAAIVGATMMQAVFPGRTATGTRARLMMFCSFLGLEGNMKYELGESAAIDSVINFLRGGTNPINAADGTSITWKTYGTVNPNRHWLRLSRKLGG